MIILAWGSRQGQRQGIIGSGRGRDILEVNVCVVGAVLGILAHTRQVLHH
jgi:hypothetical protein